MALDRAERGTDKAAPQAAHARASLLTPVAKAFSSDIGVEVASLGVQVHGGMGFIEETGAAQFYRDARIAPIYEGTNGIQAIDLVTRKLPLDGGAVVEAYLGELRGIVDAVNATNDPALGWSGVRLEEAVGSLTRATRWMLAQRRQGRERGARRSDPVSAPVRRRRRRLPVGAAGARGLAAQRRCRPAHRAGARFSPRTSLCRRLRSSAPSSKARPA